MQLQPITWSRSVDGIVGGKVETLALRSSYPRWLCSRAFFTLVQLRKINVASFPIQYNESFYQDILKRGNEALNKFAYWNGFVVGALCTRFEEMKNGKRRLYIMTLAVLAAYRGRNIGSQLLQSVLDYCVEHQIASEIALHVQISNRDAIRFYTERFNFHQGEMVENYYRRIDPPHCYLLFKSLERLPTDFPEADDTEVNETNEIEAKVISSPS